MRIFPNIRKTGEIFKGRGKTETCFFDWLGIELLRLSETGESVGSSEDRPSTGRASGEKTVSSVWTREDASDLKGLATDDQGNFLDPILYLKRRADRLLPKKTGIDPNRVRSLFGFVIKGLVPILLGIALIYYLPKILNAIEGEEIKVNLKFYYIFLTVQIFFFVVSLLILIRPLGKLMRFIPGLTSFWKGVEYLGTGSFRLISWVGENIDGWLNKFFPFLRRRERKEKGKELSSRSSSFKGSLRLFDLGKSSGIFFAGFLSQVFWLLLSLGLLASLFAQMFLTNFNYFWGGAIFSRRSHAEWIAQTLAKPFSFTPQLISVPDEESFDWLFQESSRDGLKGEEKGKEKSSSPMNRESMEQWSWFLLELTILYILIPRLILFCVYGCLFHREKMRLRPDLKDPYYAHLIQEAREWGRKNVPTTGLSGGSRDLTLVLGYDVEFPPEITPKEFWSRLLGEEEAIVPFGNVARTREEEKEFFGWLDGRTDRIFRTILMVDSSLPPSRQFRDWMRDSLFGRLPASKNYVILSCGNRLNLKFAGNAEMVAERLEEWKTVLRELSVTIPDVRYDHEIDSGEVRKLLADFFWRERMGIETGGDLSVSDFRFPGAKRIILGHVGKFLAEREEILSKGGDSEGAFSEKIQKRLSLGFSELLELYREPVGDGSGRRGRFASLFATFSGRDGKGEASGDSMVGIAAKVQKGGTGLKDRLEPCYGTLDWVNKLRKNLSPKTAAIFGVAGLSLPPLAMLGPSLAAGATIPVTLSYLGSLLPASIVTGSAGAAAGALTPMALKSLWRKCHEGTKRGEDEKFSREDMVGLSLKTLVTPLAIWGIIFELQGEEEEWIQTELPRLTAPLEEMFPVTRQDVGKVLDRVEGLLRESLDKRLPADVGNDDGIDKDIASGEENGSGREDGIRGEGESISGTEGESIDENEEGK